ncbi:MAG: DUF4226 domain-containing protein [Mycobacterium sp.]
MEGAAVEAIRDAEASLAGQQSVAAQIDLQVVIAILNAHTEHGESVGALEQLQQDVENAVAAHPDLSTAAGARSFQRYLIGKVRDIRSVVDGADLDATSKAALVAALSSLYTSSGTPDETVPAPEPAEDPNPIPAENNSPRDTAPPPTAAAPQPPAWGSAAPATGLPGLPSGSDLSPLTEQPRHRQHPDPADDQPQDPPVQTPADAANGSTEVLLPGGETITAPSPELAKVITAAVAGTPIPEAFSRQGITIAAAGSTVDEPVDPAGLTAGDVGIFTDRHALSLGNGTALVDNEIVPVTSVGGDGFLGWQHPPKPEPAVRAVLTTTP